MAVEDVTQVRNVGIVGQGGGGKTSLAEAILFDAGAVTRLGSVDDGSSNFDFEPEETRRKLSLTTAFHHAPWKKHEITLIDTPGYANFLTDALYSMRACTGLVMVLEPAAGSAKVEAERIWARAEELKLPRLGFVTKMDRDLRRLRGRRCATSPSCCRGRAIPIQLPIGSAESFRGVVDLIRMRALIADADGKDRGSRTSRPTWPTPRRRRARSSSRRWRKPTTRSWRSTWRRASSPTSSSTTPCARRFASAG